jgi:hypothetical protein
MRKPPGNLDAWVAYQRGLWHVGKTAGPVSASTSCALTRIRLFALRRLPSST